MTKEEQKTLLNLLDDEVEFLLSLKMKGNPDLIRATAACMELLEYFPNREMILKRHVQMLMKDIQVDVDAVWNSPDPKFQKTRDLFPNGKPTPEEYAIKMSEINKIEQKVVVPASSLLN